MSKLLLSELERREIHAAVQAAESRINAEIVPIFARASAAYESVYWRGGFIAAAIAGLVLTLAHRAVDVVIFMPPWLWLMICLTSGLAGAWLVGAAPAFRRLLAGRETMYRSVYRAARVHFVDHDVTHTTQRTGIMIYVSFFERRAIILCDCGIEELVPAQKWQEIVDALAAGIRAGDVCTSVCTAIAACAALVEASGIRNTADDDNELGDEPRGEP